MSRTSKIFIATGVSFSGAISVRSGDGDGDSDTTADNSFIKGDLKHDMIEKGVLSKGQINLINTYASKEALQTVWNQTIKPKAMDMPGMADDFGDVIKSYSPSDPDVFSPVGCADSEMIFSTFKKYLTKLTSVRLIQLKLTLFSKSNQII